MNNQTTTRKDFSQSKENHYLVNQEFEPIQINHVKKKKDLDKTDFSFS